VDDAAADRSKNFIIGNDETIVVQVPSGSVLPGAKWPISMRSS
jgi:hypothetical protein